jgi:hypothetical protein
VQIANGFQELLIVPIGQIQGINTRRKIMLLKNNINYLVWKMGSIIITIIIFPAILIVTQTPFAAEQQTWHMPSLSEVSKLKDSPKWSDRMRAASKILTSTNFDTSLAVSIITEGIITELKEPSIPTLSDIRGGASVNGWNDIIPVYVNDLKLLGKSILPRLILLSDSVSGEARSWLFITRGLLSDSVVHDELVKLLTDKNPNIRAMAIASIAQISAPCDIELFKTSLNDSFYIVSRSDISIDNGKSLDNKTIFPVRFEAIRALQHLGYKVLQDSLNGFIVEKRKF